MRRSMLALAIATMSLIIISAASAQPAADADDLQNRIIGRWEVTTPGVMPGLSPRVVVEFDRVFIKVRDRKLDITDYYPLGALDRGHIRIGETEMEVGIDGETLILKRNGGLVGRLKRVP